MNDAVLVLSALLLNALLGGARPWYATAGLTHIGLLPARAVRLLERKLNRDRRSTQDLEMRGWVLVIVALLAGVVLGSIGSAVFRNNLGFLEVVLVALLLPVRPIWDRAVAVRSALLATHLGEARNALAGTAWKHHAVLDEFGVARAVIETVAVDFSEKVVCPVLAYLCFGLPGLLIAKHLTLLQNMLGTSVDFGKAIRLAYQALHYIPSRFSALLWLAAAPFLPSGDIRHAAPPVLKRFLVDPPRTLCVRAAAAVIRTSLGGPTSVYAAPAWVDNGTLKALPIHIRRALAAFVFQNIFLFIFIGTFF